MEKNILINEARPSQNFNWQDNTFDRALDSQLLNNEFPMLSKKTLSKKKIVIHNLGQNIDFFTFSHSNFLSQVKWNWIIITREYMYELGLETLDLRK